MFSLTEEFWVTMEARMTKPVIMKHLWSSNFFTSVFLQN